MILFQMNFSSVMQFEAMAIAIGAGDAVDAVKIRNGHAGVAMVDGFLSQVAGMRRAGQKRKVGVAQPLVPNHPNTPRIWLLAAHNRRFLKS